VAAKFSNGNAGLVIQQRSQTEEAMFANENNPAYEIAGLRTPVMKAGDERKFGHRQNNYPGNFSWGISPKTKQLETALRFCDWFFSEEGRMLSAFGTEGLSYEIKNGQVGILQSALNHPEIRSPRDVVVIYGAPDNHALYEIKDNQRLTLDPRIAEIQARWADNNITKYIFPPVTQTAAESDVIGQKWTNIDTYCQEMIIKFIIGTEPLGNYNAFLQQLNRLGMDDVLKAKQAAYNRYQAR
jgi:putative aldouronate transport system substrate-binding protein